MFTKFDKAIAALVVAALTIASVVFKTDLSGYGDIVTGILVALIPALVYIVPNLKVLEDGQSATIEQIEGVAVSVAGSVADAMSKNKAQAPKAAS